MITLIIFFPKTELSQESITNVEVPIGTPFYYEFDEQMNNITGEKKFLGNMDEIEKKIQKTKSVERSTSAKFVVERSLSGLKDLFIEPTRESNPVSDKQYQNDNGLRKISE